MEIQQETNTKETQDIASARKAGSAMPYVAAAFAALLLMLAISAGAVLYGAVVDSKAKRVQQESRVMGLKKEIQNLQGDLKDMADEQEKTALSMQELTNRQAVRQKSQDELLTAAVNRVSSSVVSIVISKDVPKLEVVYQNPFGNDPFFRDFGLQVPVYRQNGTQKQKVGAGTGFLFDQEGYIVTNKHVVMDKNAEYTALFLNGRQLKASVVYLDPDDDIAVIKVDGKHAAASLGESAGLKLGQTVIAIGNALGEYNNSVSVGIISGLDRKITASGGGMQETLTGVIQTDAAINPGNSGGPLIDLNGRVVGVNVATVIGSNSVSFSIPIDSVKGKIRKAIGK